MNRGNCLTSFLNSMNGCSGREPDIRDTEKIAPFLACLAVPHNPVRRASSFGLQEEQADYGTGICNPPETAAPETGSGNDQRDAERSSTVSPETPAPVKNSGNERQAAVRKPVSSRSSLVQDNGGLRLFHPSLAEWLTKSEGRNLVRGNGERRFSPACGAAAGGRQRERRITGGGLVINLPARRGPD